jgi:histidine ammonia-lyase
MLLVQHLFLKNKILSHPASVDSVPTSTDKEDHVSMGVTSGRKVYEILQNLQYCLAIELLCNTKAMDFHRPLKSSESLESVYNLVRRHVKPIDVDRVFHKDIEKLAELIKRGEVINEVKQFVSLN